MSRGSEAVAVSIDRKSASVEHSFTMKPKESERKDVRRVFARAMFSACDPVAVIED